MRHQLGKDFIPITIKIHREHKEALIRRALESGRGGDYAGLIRKAIGAFLEPQPSPHVAKQLEGKTPQRMQSTDAGDLGLPFYIHRSVARTSNRTLCGLAGVVDEKLSEHDANVTCPSCERIIANNRKALSAPTPRRKPRQLPLASTRAPKKAAKRKAAKR